MDCNAPIILEIQDKIKELGDLPLFSATINRIQKIGSDPDSNAAALSSEITKDVGLTTTLLRLANSSFYSRGNSNTTLISRSIVLLGFDTIMNLSLTLKLIDSFQNEHPSSHITRLLVTAYQSASLARDLAIRTGLRNVEEVYTCTLLHTVGAIALAYFLPEKYQLLQDQLHQSPLSKHQLEKNILGTTIEQIGQCMAHSWEFPDTIVRTMEHFDINTDDRPRGDLQINRAVSSLATDLVAKLHASNSSPLSFADIVTGMTNIIGLDHKIIENCLVDSYRSSAALASIYGLKTETLIPDSNPSNDSSRDRLASRLAYLGTHINTDETLSDAPASEQPHNTAASAIANRIVNPVIADQPVIDMENLFQYVQEITALTTSGASLNLIFTKTIEGIQRSAGFDRTALCLISPDHSSYAARLVYGDDTTCLKDYFSLPVDINDDIFSSILMTGNEIVVNDSREASWTKVLKNDFYTSTGALSFIVSGLRLSNKPLGFFYADNKNTATNSEQHRCFSQFIGQVRLAVKMSAS
jgi:HD-like signal output (HDOD) protein